MKSLTGLQSSVCIIIPKYREESAARSNSPQKSEQIISLFSYVLHFVHFILNFYVLYYFGTLNKFSLFFHEN